MQALGVCKKKTTYVMVAYKNHFKWSLAHLLNNECCIIFYVAVNYYCHVYIFINNTDYNFQDNI